jgi:hypothetical protein
VASITEEDGKDAQSSFRLWISFIQSSVIYHGHAFPANELRRVSYQTTDPLQLSQNGLSTRDLSHSQHIHYLPYSSGAATYRHLTGALLVLSISDLAVVENHSPATIAVTHTGRPAMLLGEERLGIAQEQDLIALDAIDLAPSIHDPGVVRRNSSDNIDALVLELLGFRNVGGKVVGLATGCEGAGDGEENYFLVGPFFAGVVFLGAAADGRVRVGNGCPSVRAC